MAPREFDLNLVPADWDLSDGIDWEDDIGNRNGPAVRDDGEADGDGQKVHNQGDDDSCDAASGGYIDPARARGTNNHLMIGALERGDGNGSGGEEGSNVKKKKRKYYSDNLKIAIYMELLAKTDPPMLRLSLKNKPVLRYGATSQVAQQFGVPLRLVQSVWRKGQECGICGVKNKMLRRQIWR